MLRSVLRREIEALRAVLLPPPLNETQQADHQRFLAAVTECLAASAPAVIDENALPADQLARRRALLDILQRLKAGVPVGPVDVQAQEAGGYPEPD